MSSSVDYKEVLKKAQHWRKSTASIIDSYLLEIDGTPDIEGIVEGVVKCSSSKEAWEYRDRLEEMRGSMYKLHKSYSRNLAEAREAYNDSMRESMARTKNSGATAWQERQASYEIANITPYKILTQFERLVSDIDNFNKYLSGRLAWVKDRQFWLNSQEKNSRE